MYTVSIYLITLDKGREMDQPPLGYTLFIGVQADVLEKTISHFLFGLEFMGLSTTAKFDNILSLVRSRYTIRDAK